MMTIKSGQHKLYRKGQRQADIAISKRDVGKQLKTVPNWKSPGPDGIQAFWLKRFSNLHAQIGGYMNDCVRVGQVPDWVVEDRTRDSRPITCLKLLWTFLTGILAGKTYLYLLANTLLPYEQERVPKRFKGHRGPPWH